MLTSFGYPGWERVCTWFQKSDMPVVIMFATVYHWWSSDNSFTGRALIALRGKAVVSGLLKQVKEEPFSKKPQLCWCVLSLLTFLVCFSILCFSRVPRAGYWAGFMNPLRLCSKSYWLCCLTGASSSSHHLKPTHHLTSWPSLQHIGRDCDVIFFTSLVARDIT